MNPDIFRNPPKEYREVPFWSWNDTLDADELRRQIALMDEAGWGGFFMHARVGLATPYLGPQWMAAVRACVDEARERGMGAWLYDEDKWPSGFAGGLNVAGHPLHRLTCLVCKVDNRPAFAAERIATFAAREVDSEITDVRPDQEPQFRDAADRVIQFYPLTLPLGVPWFNDYAYASLLDADTVRGFLESTHDAYTRVVGGAFGGAIPGIFTDEPCYFYRGPKAFMPERAVPWSRGFPAYFSARYGYDLIPVLPSLFFDVGDFHRVRHDFWRAMTQLFVDSFTRQIYNWCDTHHLAFTGHMLAEDTLLSQMQRIGAAMPHYAYMHVPGIDKLGRSINMGAGTVLTVKQLDSVVCQLGKPRALCENFGCSGQDFAHLGRKWITDWAYVLGINLNNPHLALYSMRGQRKRDYPADLFYQQPWWPENRLIADYVARLSYALTLGQRVTEIVVIHPIASACATYRPGGSYAVQLCDELMVVELIYQEYLDLRIGSQYSS